MALLALSCERCVRRFPWSRVEEVEERARRQRMEYSLEHANAVTTVCLTLGAMALVLMSAGIVGLVSAARGPEPGSGAAWPLWTGLLLATGCTAWLGPSLAAKYYPEPIVAFWVPFLGRLVSWPFGHENGNGNGSAQAQGSDESEEEADDAEEEAREVYRSLLRLSSVTASEIMTPRINMVFVRDSATVADVLDAAERSGHSRLPVFHETRDQIVGVVYIKDLLKRLRDADWQDCPISGLVRDPFFVPETKKVDDLLQEFQRGQVHLGIVLDEYGGTAGLITIEDIIEELLGEIRDEHDPDEVRQLQRVDESSFELDAAVRVEEANDSLNLNLPEDEDFDTIGGYVAFSLGRLPAAGETFERDGVRVTILDGDKRRVKRVRVQILDGRS